MNTANVPPPPALGDNHTKPRLSSCIARILERVASAERELSFAEERHAAAREFVASGVEYTDQCAIYADPTYVADFRGRLTGHRRALAYHEAFYFEIHGEECPK